MCSKRPAIGYSYFKDHAREFQKGNFKLFSLKGDYVFPRYYFRKTRESICPYKTISATNGKPNSYSNIPSVVSLLVELQNAITFNENFLSNSPLVRCNSFTNTFTFPSKGRGTKGTITLPARYFNFYDCKNNLYYYLRGDGDYDVCTKKYHRIYIVPAKVLISELINTYNNLLDAFLRDLHNLSDIRRKHKEQSILNEYGTYENYIKEKRKVVDNLLSLIEQKQHNYELTKNQF